MSEGKKNGKKSKNWFEKSLAVWLALTRWLEPAEEPDPQAADKLAPRLGWVPGVVDPAHVYMATPTTAEGRRMLAPFVGDGRVGKMPDLYARKGVVSAAFSLDMLRKLLDMCFAAGDEAVTLALFGDDMPVVVEGENFAQMLAPRISDDEETTAMARIFAANRAAGEPDPYQGFFDPLEVFFDPLGVGA